VSFLRTSSGLSNLRLFHGAQLVVFVEGGPTIAVDAALGDGGAGAAGSVDISFWQNVFRLRRRKQPIKFRAVGSKTTLRDIATKIVGKEVRGVVVAMDRDYDHFSGRLLDAPGILYTFGYSWENDVWGDPTVIAQLFYIVAPVCRATVDVSGEIGETLRGLWRRLPRLIRADVACNKAGIEFFPKSAPGRLFDVQRSERPDLNPAHLSACIRRAKTARQGKLFAGEIVVDPPRDCCGHLVEFFAYQLVCHLARQHGVRSLPLDILRGIAINEFGSILKRHQSATKKHYTAQLRRVRVGSVAR
jgi:hypothetical protein